MKSPEPFHGYADLDVLIESPGKEDDMLRRHLVVFKEYDKRIKNLDPQDPDYEYCVHKMGQAATWIQGKLGVELTLQRTPLAEAFANLFLQTMTDIAPVTPVLRECKLELWLRSAEVLEECNSCLRK